MRDALTRGIRVGAVLWLVSRETGVGPIGMRGSWARHPGLSFTAFGHPRRFLPLAAPELPTAAGWASLPEWELVALFHRTGG